MNNEHIKYWVAVHTLVLTSLFLITIGFWLVYPYKPLTFPTQPFPILNKGKVIQQGDTIIIDSNSCRNFTGTVTVHRTLIDHSLIDYPDITYYQEKKACQRFENRTLQVPSYAPTGIYHVEITSIVKVNPIRTIAVKVKTENFRVIEREVHK